MRGRISHRLPHQWGSVFTGALPKIMFKLAVPNTIKSPLLRSLWWGSDRKLLVSNFWPAAVMPLSHHKSDPFKPRLPIPASQYDVIRFAQAQLQGRDLGGFSAKRTLCGHRRTVPIHKRTPRFGHLWKINHACGTQESKNLWTTIRYWRKLVQDLQLDARWTWLPSDILLRIASSRIQPRKSVLRLVNKHWRTTIDEGITQLTIDKRRIRSAGLDSRTVIKTAEAQFSSVTVLKCNCPLEADWLAEICCGPFSRVKELALGGDVDKQSFTNLKNCTALEKLYINSRNLDPEQFEHLSYLSELQVLDMKCSSTDSRSIANFGRLSKLKASPTSDSRCADWDCRCWTWAELQ